VEQLASSVRISITRIFELGEQPEAILSGLAKMTVGRISSGTSPRMDSSTLAGWTDDVIQRYVELALAETRKTLGEAIADLRGIAEQIARSDMPSGEEAEILLRNAPRFETASPPGPIGAPYWRWLGRRIVGSLARRNLRRAFGESFRQQLHRYALALRQWSEHAARSIHKVVTSYVDAYRAQLSRMCELSPGGGVSPEIEDDLSMLLKWNNETAETAQTRG
jgi:hypothetical protein